MNRHTPPEQCAEPGCIYLGWWDNPGGHCPHHRRDHRP